MPGAARGANRPAAGRKASAGGPAAARMPLIDAGSESLLREGRSGPGP
jgi:hypothetical protein